MEEIKRMVLESKDITKGYELVAYFKNGGKYLTATFEKEPSMEAWHAVASELWDLVEEAYNDDRNYGLSFLACGYDGQAQTEFVRGYRARFGAQVF